MKGVSQIGNGVSFGRFISVCTLILCLIFLTSLNYFIYPDVAAHQHTAVDADDSDNAQNTNGGSGPTEEKSCSSGITILEEFLHEHHFLLNFEMLNQQYLHQVAEADKIEVFHGELISPPPER
jgi:hypothetical protein